MTSCPLSRSLFYLRFVLLVVSARLSSRHAISKLDNSPQHRNISCNAKQVNVQLECLMFCRDVCTLSTIRHYAEPFHAALHCLYVRCTIRHYAEPFHATLHHLCVRCTIRHYAELFHATLHRLCLRCVTRHNPEPFDATLHRLCTVLQMSAKLFVIELVHLQFQFLDRLSFGLTIHV